MQGVLFDLDGTLLDIDLGRFVGRYFDALARVAGERYDGVDLIAEISASTEAMMSPHPGATNREVFFENFLRRTNIDIAADWKFFERFYEDVFPGLKREAAPKPGARRALDAAKSLGLKVAIATNPIFPAAAIRHRLEWAGISADEADTVTTYENMHACKPAQAYFRETAARIGLPTTECLMVGDDRYLDLPAADVGMLTFYVGPSPDARADYRGDLGDLADLLPRLVRDRP